MPEMRDLYQETILDHNKKPRNFRAMENATRKLEGFNPLCGDRLTIYLHIVSDRIEDISFEGNGCAISKSSASLMTTAIKGKTLAEAETLFNQFHAMVTTPLNQTPDIAQLGKLAVFSGVREFPARIKCAILPWHTLHAAIENKQELVTTE